MADATDPNWKDAKELTMGEWRKVTNTIGETGTADREEDTYQFGAEIDGVFVPAVTKSAGYIDHLVSIGRQAQEQAAKDNPPATTTETTGTQTATDTTANTGDQPASSETTGTEGQ